MKRFTIAVSGLSDADGAELATALDSIHATHWQLVDGTAAYLTVVDIDTLWGHMEWLRATANGQHVAAYTVNDQVRDADLVLHKPLQPAELERILKQLELVAEQRRAMTGPDLAPMPDLDTLPDANAPAMDAPVAPVDASFESALTGEPESAPTPTPVAFMDEAHPPEPEPEPGLEPEPEPLSLGAALLAGAITQPLYLRMGDITLCLDPARGGYTGPDKLKPLAPLLLQLLETASTPEDAALQRMRVTPAQPLARLLWFAALTATPGQLAPTLDVDGRYRLDRWPQIEREFPRHFRIATAMMKQAGTLAEIAASAKTPEADVADFINAYSVAGYVSREAPPAAPTETARDNARSVLSRLRRPFSRHRDTPSAPESEPASEPEQST